MGGGLAAANGLVRFSLGRESSFADVELAADTLATVVGQIRRHQ
jgi:cysteine sulfinate desulfinase/cysteine desulfurase-like protein